MATAVTAELDRATASSRPTPRDTFGNSHEFSEPEARSLAAGDPHSGRILGSRRRQRSPFAS